MSTFNTKSAWWAFNLVNQYSDTNFQKINAEVQVNALQIDSEATKRIEEWEKEADSKADEAMSFLTERTNTFAVNKVDEWWSLAWHLFAKYGRYVVTYNESAKDGTDALGQLLPEWWLKMADVGFATWSPRGPFIAVPDTGCRGHPVTAIALPDHTISLATGLAAIAVLLGYAMGLSHGRAQAQNNAGFCYVEIDP